jgi:hypothetical protein
MQYDRMWFCRNKILQQWRNVNINCFESLASSNSWNSSSLHVGGRQVKSRSDDLRSNGHWCTDCRMFGVTDWKQSKSEGL